MQDSAAVTAETLELLKRSAAVPSMPQVVTRFLEITQDPEFDYDDVVEVLSTDPGVASEILRLANSALFGVTRKVTNLRQALALLGLRRVRSLVLGRYIVQSVSTAAKGTIDMSYFWRRSLASAVLAARFADSLLPACREEAFVVALLSDIGVVIMADALKGRYKPIAEHYRPCQPDNLCDMEKAVLGITHADVSAMVLEHWQLPELIVEAVRHHHDWPLPEDLPDDVATLARIANGSGMVAKLLCERPEPEHVVEVCRKAMDLVGLEVTVLAEVIDKIEADIEEMAEVLRADVISSSVYELIAKQVRTLINDAERTPAK